MLSRGNAICSGTNSIYKNVPKIEGVQEFTLFFLFALPFELRTLPDVS